MGASRLFIAGAVVAASIMGSAVPASAQNALSIFGANWASSGVTAGAPLIAELSGVSIGSPKCSAVLSGPSKSTKSGLRLSNWKLRIPTSGLRPGVYSVTLKCPGSKSLALPKVAVVPKGQPTTGTCVVADSGFTASPPSFGSSTVLVGFLLQNTSAYVPSSFGDVLINVLDASGKILESDSGIVEAIPPSSTRPAHVFMSVSGGPVASVQITTSCSEPRQDLDVLPQLDIPASAFVRADEPGVEGVLTNSTQKPWLSDSLINYVSRDAAGRITGGGSTDLAVTVPPGASIRWDDIPLGGPTLQIASAQATITLAE